MTIQKNNQDIMQSMINEIEDCKDCTEIICCERHGKMSEFVMTTEVDK